MQFMRKGRGGRVLNGYRKAADVKVWDYAPTDESGAGVVNVTLVNVSTIWLRGDRFDLELIDRNGKTLRWTDVELMGESFMVTTSPT
jgi:hypothetical protein